MVDFMKDPKGENINPLIKVSYEGHGEEEDDDDSKKKKGSKTASLSKKF